MKNLIITLLFLLIFSVSYGQDKPCPTKEETMEWIAGKMKQYLQSPRTFQSYSSGVFKYKKLSPYDDGSYGGYNIITIDLNKLTYFNCSIDSTQIYTFEGNKICTTVMYNEKGQYDKTEYSNSVKTWYSDCDDCLFGFSQEYGIGVRLYRALICLEKYTLKTEGEKF
jgi:hypothetical protein